MSEIGHGLSRRELEAELRWLMRRAPQDSAKLPEFIGELVITLIDKNNQALARSASEQDRPDMPEAF